MNPLFYLLFLQQGDANALFEQARQTVDPARKVMLLEKSIAAGNSFAAQYALGEAFRKLSNPERAETAFLEAIRITNDRKELARASYRLGLISEDRGSTPDAIAWMTVSNRYYPYPESAESLKKLELSRLDKVLSANQIVSALSNVSRSAKTLAAVNVRINFEFDSAQVEAEGARQLEELANALNSAAFGNRGFRLVGHSDVRGGEEYNTNLSLRRAQAVAGVLAKRGVAKERLATEGRGLREPLFTGNDEEDHRLNRRVEVQLVR